MNLFNIKKQFIIGFISTFLLFNIANTYAAQNAGRVVFSFGKGTIKGADNKLRPLKRGALLRSGDEIITKYRARAQIKLKDGSFFSLKPDTQFKIENFVYKKKKAEDKSFFGLVKGGFRALTGLIGKSNKSAYRVNTPVATIGIRGTDYDVIITPPTNGSKGSLITHTNSGAISLTNGGGTQVFGAGQSAFVANNQSAPRRATPAEATKVATPVNKPKKDKKEATEKKQVKKKAPKQVKKPKKDDPTQTTKNEGDRTEKKAVTGGGDDINLASTTVASPDSFIYSPRVASYAGSKLNNSGSGYAGSLDKATVVTDQYGSTSAITDGGAGRVASISGTVSNFGNNSDTGISWGRWIDATVTDSSSTTFTNSNGLASAVHWATGPVVTMPSTGTASYSVIGNTAPTDSDGNLGVLGTVELNANFASQTIDRLSVEAAVGNNTWTASESNIAINASTGGFSTTTAISGTVTNATGSDALDTSSSISGNFTGLSASGAVMTYLLTNPATGNVATTSVTGAVGLKK